MGPIKPILFNIFFNDLVHFVESDLGNFADDISISDAAKTIPALIKILENEANNAIKSRQIPKFYFEQATRG